MYPPTLILSLSISLLTTSTIAIPFVPRAASETLPTNSQSSYTDNDKILDSLVTQSAKESSNLNTCPPSHPSKQCCMSITALANGVTSEIGEVVPLLSDVKISSIVSLECRPMDADGDNATCLNDVMCCTGTGGSKSSLMKTCKPWDEALESKKKALDKNINKQLEQMMSKNGTSSSASRVAASSTPKPKMNPVAEKVARVQESVSGLVGPATSSASVSSSASTSASSSTSTSTAKSASTSSETSNSSKSTSATSPTAPTEKATKVEKPKVDTTSTAPSESTTVSAPASLSTIISQKEKEKQKETTEESGPTSSSTPAEAATTAKSATKATTVSRRAKTNTDMSQTSLSSTDTSNTATATGTGR
ncbi:uncharacterized protein LDX57_012208 [Aspergillus melleus]|uniref:uncharacterized protein n=1 Tax=Aspergillus melleus TaxID=138277 RepID=UPI001E8EAD31|nr:uncharacterized protein LDX57_012208 [Aspergillus melleus]KAH8434565.1 hypothetical protein LDX57_012208 [Aspergillus melleus]